MTLSHYFLPLYFNIELFLEKAERGALLKLLHIVLGIKICKILLFFPLVLRRFSDGRTQMENVYPFTWPWLLL